MDLLSQIQDMQANYEKLAALDEKYRKMFELAGYALYTEEDDDGKSRPKDTIELLEEALGNPPSDEPACWIRISDIPRYIEDYLIVAKGVDLDEFNEEAKTSLAPRRNRPTIKPEDPAIDEKPLPEPGSVEDIKSYVQGNVMDGMHETGRRFTKAGQAPKGTTVLDSIGAMWHKKDANHWVQVEDNPTMEPFADADVSAGTPLLEVEPDA